MKRRGRPAKVAPVKPVVSVEPAEPQEAPKPEKKIYFTVSPSHSIANFQKEIKEGGHIVQPEAPLVIYGVLETDDPDKIAFIESSLSFRSGEVELVKSHAHAAAKRHEYHRSRMEVRQLDSDVENQGLLKVSDVASAGQGAG